MLINQLEDQKTNAERQHVLSWMTALCLAARETRCAEGYMLELLAYCAFAIPDSKVVFN